MNIASRMESHGAPGRIQVTNATHDLLQKDFVFEHRGPVEVKGKGEMDTWYLTGEHGGTLTRTALIDASSPKFRTHILGAREMNGSHQRRPNHVQVLQEALDLLAAAERDGSTEGQFDAHLELFGAFAFMVPEAADELAVAAQSWVLSGDLVRIAKLNAQFATLALMRGEYDHAEQLLRAKLRRSGSNHFSCVATGAPWATPT